MNLSLSRLAKLYGIQTSYIGLGGKRKDATPEALMEILRLLGANVRFMSPNEHDEILAHISHVPHLLAFALMKSIPDQFLEYATQGLRDTTRVAASDPKMWSDIFTSNTKSVLKSLDECAKALGVFRKAIGWP